MTTRNCWFKPPKEFCIGDMTTQSVILVLPVKGETEITADMARETSELSALLGKYENELHFHSLESLPQRLTNVVANYKNTAANALSGAESVRNDMLVYLRSVLFVLESVVGEHLNHSQKNERIRGTMSVLERHVQSLREEKFEFHSSMWRRDRDLFRWNETERYLRERVRALEAQIVAVPIVAADPDDQPF